MQSNLSLWVMAITLFFSSGLVGAPAQFVVRAIDGTVYTSEFDTDMTRRELYDAISRRIGIPVDRLKVIFRGQYEPLDDEKRVPDYVQETVIHLVITGYQLSVRTLSGQSFQVSCPPITSGKVLYTLVSAKSGIPADEIRLIFAGGLIPSGNEIVPVAEYAKEATIQLVRRSGKIDPADDEEKSTAKTTAPAPGDFDTRQIKIYGASELIPFTIIPEITTNSNLYDLVSAVSGYKVEDLTIRRLGFIVPNNDELIGEVDPRGEVISFTRKPGAQRLVRLDAPAEAAVSAAVVPVAGPGEIAAARPVEVADHASGDVALPRLRLEDYNNLFELEEFLIQNLDQAQVTLIRLPLDDKQDLATPLNLAKLEKFLMRHKNQNYSRLITLPFGIKSDLVV